MKKFLRRKFSFKNFLLVVFVLFFLTILFNTGKFFFNNREISRQNVTLLTQSSFVSEGSGGFQVFLKEVKNNGNIEKADIEVNLFNSNSEKVVELYKGEINNGLLANNFKLPVLETGKYEMRVVVDSKFGKDEIVKGLEIVSDSKIMVSTDRPLYKPGQKMDFRVLMLDKMTLKPFAGKELTVAILDPKDNKIFQKEYKTSEYGIVSDDFNFSDELTFGNYKLEVLADDITAEKYVEVKHFKLPKFEVEIITNESLEKIEKQVTGDVLVKYFFGKPVVDADVNVVLDLDGYEMRYTNKTDENGFVNFNFGFNEHANPQRVSISAEVTDKNKETIIAERSAESVNENIVVELIPESGVLKPGIDNEILFISSKSDGTPVKTDVFMTGEKLREFTTNEFGIAKFIYRPDDSNTSKFNLTVSDDSGNTLKKVFKLNNEKNNIGHLLVRTDKTLYEDDNIVDLEIYGTKDDLAQIEFIQDSKVVYAESVELKDGKVEKEIDLPDHVFGTVELRVSQIYTKFVNNKINTNVVSDSKIILVDQAKNLNVDISLDKKTYLPGDEATVSFEIEDEEGNKENSAISLKIVDEALLALQDDDDKLSKLLFLVDDKIRNNARSINGLTWDKVLEDDDLEIRDNILQAIMLDVPREGLAFSKINKDNLNNWRIYQEKRQSILNSIFLFLIFVLVSFVIRFWWNFTLYTGNKQVTGKFWLSSFIVFVFATIAGTLFVDGYSFFDKIGELFNFTVEDSFYNILGFKWFPFILLALFILCLFTFVKNRKSADNNYPVSISLIGVFLMYTVFSFIAIYEFNLTDIVDSEFGFIVSLISLPVILIGSLGILALRNLSEGSFTILSWVYVLLIGIISLMFGPAIIGICILVAIFSSIQSVSGDKFDFEQDLQMLELDISKNPKDVESKKIELIFLKQKLKRKKIFNIISRVIFWMMTIGFLLFAYIVFVDNYGRFDLDDMFKIILMFIFFFSIPLTLFGSFKWLGAKNNNEIKFSRILTVVFGIISTFILIIFIINFFGKFKATTSVSHYEYMDSGVGSSFGLEAGRSSDSIALSERRVSLDNAISSGSGFELPSFNFPNKGSRKVEYDKEVVTEEAMIVGGEDIKTKEDFKKAKRVRKFFPETMFWQPELIAEDGKAEIKIPVKDSITKWRLSALANSLSGKVGGGETNLISFQDFFIDFDLPVNLTKGDEFILAVNVFNYLEDSQKIKLNIREANWFELENSNNQVVELEANETKIIPLKIKLKKFGNYTLRIDAEGTEMPDAVEKTFKVLPYGKRITRTVASEHLDQNKVDFQALIPSDVINGTEKIRIKIYPSVLSEIVEGLDNMLRFPSGCFEQTSSSLYPNILVLKYLEETKQDLPDVRKRAEEYIEAGMQKLLMYEVDGGGFSLYGDSPAETILTAYGLMEFNEMSQVSFVDQDLINRTKDFLFKKRNTNGGFKITGRHNGGFSGGNDFAKNAYIIWALSEVDPKDVRLENSIKYLESNFDQIKSSSYALALTANAFVNYDKEAKYTKEAISELKQKVGRSDDGQFYIKLDKPTHYGSYGRAGNIEVTALSSIAFANYGDSIDASNLNKYIIKSKDGHGTWGSTQASILALKSLVANEMSDKKAKDDKGELKITFNENEEKIIEVDEENSEVVQYIVFEDNIEEENKILVEKTGKIDANIQIIKDYYTVWDEDESNPDLYIDFDFGRIESLTKVKDEREYFVLGKSVDMYAFVYADNQSVSEMENMILEIPIPAGFEIDRETLKYNLRSGLNGKVSGLDASRFEIKNDRIIFYIDNFSTSGANLGGSHRTIPTFLRFIPKSAGEFKIMPARVYSYYDPSKEGFSEAIGKVKIIEEDLLSDDDKISSTTIGFIE